MSMNEKRYFKIYCKRHIIGSQNKYLLLFDYLQNSKKYKGNNIDEFLQAQKFSTDNVPSDMNYLRKIIYKSLNEFHAEKTNKIKIKQHLITVEILFHKGLYKDCLKLINKLKKLPLIDENPALMIEVLNWEKKCVGYSLGILGAIEVNNAAENYFDQIKLDKFITDIYYKSYYLKNSVKKINDSVTLADFKNIITQISTIDEKEIVSVKLKIFYYLIYSNYYNIKNEATLECNYLKNTLNCFDENKLYKYENPLDYIAIATRYINLLKNNDNTFFYDELNKLKNFKDILDIQKNVANERIFLFTNIVEIEHLLVLKEFQKALHLIDQINTIIQTTKYNIEPYYYIKLYYLYSTVYCLNNNFSMGLKYINKIFNEYKFSDRPNIFIRAEVLNIIIHYEIKNYDLVIRNIKNINKKFSIYNIEKKLLKTILKISTNPLSINEKNEFSKLRKKILLKTNIQDDSSLATNYSIYISKK